MSRWRVQHKDDLTYHMTAHLRMNADYWVLTALCIMKHKDALDAEETIEYVMSCWDEEAGVYQKSPTTFPSSESTRARPVHHNSGTNPLNLPLSKKT